MSDSKIVVVQRMYEAFGRGDVDAILAEVADDVECAAEAASRSVPWFGTYRGKGEMAELFKQIASSIDLTDFTPLSLTSNETDVMATLRVAWTAKVTGRTVTLHVSHWWQFTDGKVVNFRFWEDTEQSAAAFS